MAKTGKASSAGGAYRPDQSTLHVYAGFWSQYLPPTGIPYDTWTTVGYDQEWVDTHSEFNTGAHKLTVAETGIYHVAVVQAVSIYTGSGTFTLRLKKNTETIDSDEQSVSGSNVYWFYLSAFVELSAGDELLVDGHHDLDVGTLPKYKGAYQINGLPTFPYYSMLLFYRLTIAD